MAHIVKAFVTFLSPSNGGRLSPAMNGIKPQLKLGTIFTSCVVHSLSGESVFEPGRRYEVDLELIFGDRYASLLDIGKPVELYEGSRLIAVGEFSDPK